MLSIVPFFAVWKTERETNNEEIIGSLFDEWLIAVPPCLRTKVSYMAGVVRTMIDKEVGSQAYPDRLFG